VEFLNKAQLSSTSCRKAGANSGHPIPAHGVDIMLAASAKFRPALAWFARQIAPSVLATLIAALVIAGYNRAFSGHLQQPRMAALHAAMDKATATQPTAAVETDAIAKPKPAWTQMVEIIAPTGDIERSFDKDEGREAVKDQSKLKVADAAPAAAPAPSAPRPVAVRQEPRQEFRPELRQPEPRQEWREPREPQVVVVDPRGPAPMAPPPGGYLAVQQPVVVQPAPIAVAPMAAPMVPVAQPPVAAMPVAPPVAQEPPPVIAAKPMVTVPDRPGLRPAYETQAPGQVQQPQQQAEVPQQQQRPGVLGTIVETLKPSSLFRSAREFGDKIEAAGNDILPNIRQQ
jgi:hypothetical protein